MTDLPSLTRIADNGLAAYIAKPQTPPKAAIIVVQEIFGVNQGIRQKCDQWAELGYLAVAPDLFWRIKPEIDLNPDIDEQMQQALTYFGQYNPDDGVSDIELCLARINQGLDAMPPLDKVGVIGFCLGGRLAYMAACRTNISAAVAYYPVMIEQMLDEGRNITKPILIHQAGADSFVSPEAQAKINHHFADNKLVTIKNYPGLNHGFASSSGNRRNDQAAKLADKASQDFFAVNL